MSYSAVKNNPIIVNLLTAANDTGWSLPGDGTAVHVTCNSGYNNLLNYPVKSGRSYTFTFTIISINAGYVAAFVGGAGGIHYTAPAIVVETLTATADGIIRLFSNANCTVQQFNVKDVTVDDPATIVYSPGNRKWSDFRQLYPDFGFSLYEFTILAKEGALYAQQNGSESRNFFFGVQYQSSIKFADAKLPAELKSYNSIALQSNQLLVTTAAGITTSLGQVSSLIDQDFLKSALDDGVSAINVYSQVGIYSASFLKDQNQDLINGDQLAGNYIIIELVTETGNKPLQLFSIAINASQKHIGTR